MQTKGHEKAEKKISCPIDGELMVKEDCEGCGWFKYCWSIPSFIV